MASKAVTIERSIMFEVEGVDAHNWDVDYPDWTRNVVLRPHGAKLNICYVIDGGWAVEEELWQGGVSVRAFARWLRRACDAPVKAEHAPSFAVEKGKVFVERPKASIVQFSLPCGSLVRVKRTTLLAVAEALAPAAAS